MSNGLPFGYWYSLVTKLCHYHTLRELRPRLAKALAAALTCIIMKRLFAIGLLFLALAAYVRAGADEDYVQIYTLIQDGDALELLHPDQALAKFTEAQTQLQRFQRIYPGWNDRVVNFRLSYLGSKILILSAKTSNSSNAPAVAAQNKPAAPPSSQPVAPPVRPPDWVLPPAQPPPVVHAVTSAPPVVVSPAQPSGNAEFQRQIADLQNQLKRLQDDKSLLEAKLREALAARPAGADPRELAKAQDQIRMIQKQNELLQVTLLQEQQKAATLANSSELAQVKRELEDTKHQLADQTARATRLAQENTSLQVQLKTLSTNDTTLASLRTENESLRAIINRPKAAGAAPVPESDLSRQLAEARTRIAALESDQEVWRLEKIALQNRVKQLSSQTPTVAANPVWAGDSEHVKQLERERDELQRKLDTAQKELYGRNSKTVASQVDQLAEELETLRARLDVYESKAVPYTPEELALFKKPDVADPHEGEKSVRELPPGTVELVAAAQRDFSERSFQQAEQKYLEVLKHDSKNANTLANLAAIQLEMGHYEDAEKNLKAALASSPDDAFSLSLLGNLKFRESKYDDALNALSRAAKLEPQNPEIQNFLGLTLSEKGMRSAAETAFRKAVILNPNYGGAQNNLAVFYLTQKPPSVELARWHYQKALATGFPRNPDLEKLLDEHPVETAQ
jgi:tetratricopeptide (TPR) repeat protein